MIFHTLQEVSTTPVQKKKKDITYLLGPIDIRTLLVKLYFP